ncbi:MAG: hypothetical protein EXS05_16430 [Planctomycetaceae bacterium]|nr:hypothetical protein [Planctomycetaceae bacterium]
MPATALVQLEIHALRPLAGPNIWFDRPAWEFQLDSCGIDDENLRPLAGLLLETMAEAASIPRFGASPFPAIVPRVAHQSRSDAVVAGASCSRCRRLEAAATAPFAAALMADLCLYLQVLADSPVSASALAKADAADSSALKKGDRHRLEPRIDTENRCASEPVPVFQRPDDWLVAVEFEEEPLGRAAIETSRQLIEAAARHEPFDWPDALERFRELAAELRLGFATGSIVAAACARDIPYMRLDAESLVQLGHGVKQRRIRMATTDGTGHVANFVAIDKDLTKRLLSRIGIPVPLGRPVVDADDACRAAAEFGWPVVVKPQDADYGNGASIRLTDLDQVRAAYPLARRWSERVLVERFVQGAMHRLLVVGDRLVAAVRLGPACITGDGVHTIHELVASANRDSRRGTGNPFPLRPIELGPEELTVLAEQQWTADSIPPSGAIVPLRRDVFFSRGGTIDDVTDRVHPITAEAAIDAARVVGLDVAGIDLIAVDISRPLAKQEAAVLEVDAEPSIALHMAPWCDPDRPVARAIIEMLFPDGDDGRLPVVAVVGATGRELASEIAGLCDVRGMKAGYANDHGAWLTGRAIAVSPSSLRDNLQSLWLHPRTAAAVVELSLDDIVDSGLPFDRCDVLVIAGLDNDSVENARRRFANARVSRVAANPARSRLSTAARALECLLNSLSSPCGLLLNLDDPAVAAFAETVSPAAVLVSRDPDHPLLTRHLHRGGRAVTCERETFILHRGCSREPRTPAPCGSSFDPPVAKERSDAPLLACAATFALELVFVVPASSNGPLQSRFPNSAPASHRSSTASTDAVLPPASNTTANNACNVTNSPATTTGNNATGWPP